MRPIIFIKDLREQLAKFDDLDLVVIEVHDAIVGEDLYQFNLDVVKHHRGDSTEKFKEVRLCLIPNNS